MEQDVSVVDLSADRLYGRGHVVAACSVLAIAAIIVSSFVLHASWLLQNHDMDWMMIAARRLLAGGRYISDFDEVTPPLILLLLAPPAALAAPIGVDPYMMFLGYVCLLIAGSVFLARPVLSWCVDGNPLLCCLLLIAYTMILSHEPGYEFGQREHIFLIMFLPGLLWYAAREAGRNVPMGVTDWFALLSAAAGVLIKPYYLLIPGTLLLVSLYRRRSWRSLLDLPAVVFAGAVVLYALVVLLAFPEYLEEAQLQRQIYFAWDRAWITVAEGARDAIAAFCLAVVFSEFLPAPPPLRYILRYLCLACACCLIVAIMQKRGWPYHMLPATEIAACALSIAAASMLPRLRLSAAATPAGVVLGTAGLLIASLFLRPLSEAFSLTQQRYAERPLIRKLHELAAGQPVMLLTSGLQMGFPSLAGVQVASRHPGQTLLGGTVRLERGNAQERAQAAPLRRTMFDLTVRDLQRYKPTVVAVDVNPQKQAMPDNFDMLAYFTADPGFRDAWAEYKLTASVPGWDMYTRTSGR
jgi:hypothetical protein